MTLIKEQTTKVLSYKKLVEAFFVCYLCILNQNGIFNQSFLFFYWHSMESYVMQNIIIFFNMKNKNLSDYIKEYWGPDCAPTI